jgi:type 1 glutamine amidotransferase
MNVAPKQRPLWLRIMRAVGWLVLAVALAFAVFLWVNRDLMQRVVFGGLKIYEATPPALPAEIKRPAILVFSKTNGFRHEEAIPAANTLFQQMAADNGWGYFQTENGATFNPAMLSRFDAVIFNNASGDVLTPDQRAAFKAFIEAGGGFVGVHAAGDNSHAAWNWYMQSILGATFTEHTMRPQFQTATVKVEDATHPVVQKLPGSWRHLEEWYSFDHSPRTTGAKVLITVDEQTYQPVGFFGRDLRMGDHPMVWSRCVGKGRVLYSAFGHHAATFKNQQQRQLLRNAIRWTLKLDGTDCSTQSVVKSTVSSAANLRLAHD